MVHRVIAEMIEDVFPYGEPFSSPSEELCFSIAHRNLDQILLLTQQIAQTSPALFNQSSTEYHLTPLHVCALVQDHDTAALILGYDVQLLPDLYKWTPLHHAVVLEDEKMKALLLSAIKMNDQAMVMWKNDTGGTYLDFERYLRIPRIMGPVFSFVGQDGIVRAGDSGKFQEMTGAAYCPEVVVTPASLLEEWVCPHERDVDVSDPDVQPKVQTIRRSFETYRATPPKLVLSKQNALLGCDVFAGQDFEPGDVVTVYGGMQKAKFEPKSRNHVLGNTDGEKVCNLGPMVNDSFPNCTAHSLYDVDGISEVSLLVACDSIKKGDRICWNYGLAHDVKKKAIHIELRAEAMERFFKENPCDTWIEVLQSDSLKENIFQIESFTIKLRYLFETPTSLLTCILKGLISTKEVQYLVIEKDLFTFIELSSSLASDTLYLVNLVEEFLEKHSHENQIFVRRNILSLLNQYHNETLLIAFGFWRGYPIRGGLNAHLRIMENQISAISQLVNILHSNEENKRKALRMTIVFQKMPSGFRDELFDCFSSIITMKYPDFLKNYKKIHEKLDRI